MYMSFISLLLPTLVQYKHTIYRCIDLKMMVFVRHTIHLGQDIVKQYIQDVYPLF